MPHDAPHRLNYTSYSKRIILKKQLVFRWLAGQEKISRARRLAQPMLPEVLRIRARDTDVHRILKVALTSFPKVEGIQTLEPCLAFGTVDDFLSQHNGWRSSMQTSVFVADAMDQQRQQPNRMLTRP